MRAVELAIEEDRAVMEENIRKRIEGSAASIRYTYRCRHKMVNCWSRGAWHAHRSGRPASHPGCLH